jgi:hypothetical protein
MQIVRQQNRASSFGKFGGKSITLHYITCSTKAQWLHLTLTIMSALCTHLSTLKFKVGKGCNTQANARNRHNLLHT